MLEMFYPRRYEVSTYVVPFNYYHAQEMQSMTFNIDDTLVPYDVPADRQVVGLFERLHVMGMKTCPLPDSKGPRVKPFAGFVGSCYIYKAGESGVKGYEKVMELMGTNREYTPFVRDQLFTDVYDTNRAGLYSILVKSINPREEMQIMMKCCLEKLVLYFYKKHTKDIDQYRE